MVFFLSFFSSLLFLRVGYVIGNAGLLYGLLQLFISYVILCCTVCSISAIATNGSVKGHSIYIRTVSFCNLLSALLNWFMGPFRQSNMQCSIYFYPKQLNFNRGPSKLDAPISSKQFYGLKFLVFKSGIFV